MNDVQIIVLFGQDDAVYDIVQMSKDLDQMEFYIMVDAMWDAMSRRQENGKHYIRPRFWRAELWCGQAILPALTGEDLSECWKAWLQVHGEMRGFYEHVPSGLNEYLNPPPPKPPFNPPDDDIPF